MAANIETETKDVKPRVRNFTKKAPNWSSKQTSVLIDLCQEHPVIDQKYDNHVTKEAKKKAWSTISAGVSAVEFPPRSPEACRKRQQNIKNRSSTAVRKWVTETRRTGNNLEFVFKMYSVINRFFIL